MTDIVDSYARGSLVKLSYVVEEGSLAGVTGAQAYWRKLSQANRRELVAADPVAVPMTTVYRAANGGVGEGYDCSLSAAVSAQQEVGNYCVDLKLTTAAGSEITESVVVHIHEAAGSRIS